MIVTLNKAKSNGAPISRYNVIVEPAISEGSTDVVLRRRRYATNDNGENCFKRDIDYSEFLGRNYDYYYAAEFKHSDFVTNNDVINFEVGDGRNYSTYYNAPLDPTKEYKVWFQAISVEPNCRDNCDMSASCKIVASTDGVTIVTVQPPVDVPLSPDGTTESVVQTGESVLLYGSVAFVLLLILFVFVGSVVCIRRRAMLRSPEQYQVNTAETKVPYARDSYKEGEIKGSGPYQSDQKKPFLPDLVEYPSSSRRSEAEDFAVRVEDFPIHVSQVRLD